MATHSPNALSFYINEDRVNATKMPEVIIVRARAIDTAITKVADDLAAHGYKVTLLVWDRQGDLHATDGTGYSEHVFRLKAPYDKGTILFFLPLWWLYETYFLLRRDCDIVHACDLDTLYPAVVAKLVKRIKLCYHIYDFYADNMPHGRLMPVRRALMRLIASVEKAGIGGADVLFLADESRLEEIRGARIRTLAYLYNAPRDYCGRADAATPAAKLTIFYAGVTEPKRGLSYMVRALRGVDGVRLVLAGALTDERVLQDAGDVQYLGWLPSYDAVLQHTAAADVLFRFSDPTWPKTKYESPNKLFEAMMCAKPIIVSDESRMADIVREEKCGLVVPYGDEDALREAIITLRDDPTLRTAFGTHGRRAYEERYGWDLMTQRLLTAYCGLHRNREDKS